MDVQTSLNRIEELFRIMYLGLWVLWAETRWIAGPDIGYQRRLTLMRRRQEAIQDELSRMATLADPRREPSLPARSPSLFFQRLSSSGERFGGHFLFFRETVQKKSVMAGKHSSPAC